MWTPDPSIIITAEMKAAKAQADLMATFQTAIQEHVDQAARSRQYNDGVTLASYTASTIPTWQADAVVFVVWRDAVWVYAYAELDKVQGGERDAPTVEAFIAELPAIAWPE